MLDRTKAKLSRTWQESPPVVWIIVILIVAFSLLSDNYFQVSNFRNILIQSVSLMLVAFAQTLIVLTQGTDLSLGSQVSLVTVMWLVLAKGGVPIYLSAIITLAVTMTAGAINGLIIAKGKIPPFIATLGMQGILFSFALLLTSGSSIYFYDDIFIMVTESALLTIPLPVWITAFMFLITWTLLNRTRLGAQIRGLGGNQEALVLAGINITKSYVLIYAYAGVLTTVSGLLTACRLESGQPTVGIGWEFEAVAATLLGGTSLREGKGTLGGTIFGVILISVVKNGLNVSGIQSIYQNAAIGLIILSAIVIDMLVRRWRLAGGAR